MHEISILENVLKTCRKVAAENDVSHIQGITLSVGELSGIIPHFFTEYFPIITKDESLFDGTELKIREISGEALCQECSCMYNVMKTEGKCPRCSSRNKTIIGGQEIILEELLV